MKKKSTPRYRRFQNAREHALRFESLEARTLLDAAAMFDATTPQDGACLASLAAPRVEERGALCEELAPTDSLSGGCPFCRGDADSDDAFTLAAAAALDNTLDDMLVALGQDPENIDEDFVFNLSSNPESTHLVYLDFDGFYTTNSYWNSQITNGRDFETPPYDVDGDPTSFSNLELRNIYEIWLIVSEDYMPFDINVTTVEPTVDELTNTGGGEEEYGVRVCIGGSYDDWYGSRCLGISFVGSFTFRSDTPVYIFSEYTTNPKFIGDAATHEAGHSLKLYHDGDAYGDYHYGSNGWAPIMGGTGSQPLVQWSKGEYDGATNHEDDLAIIRSYGGFDYRPDDHGNTFDAATPLTFAEAAEIGSGIIEQNTDVDCFSFELNGEEALVRVGGIDGVTDLDALVSIYDSSFQLVETFDPTDALYVTIDVSQYEPGLYYMTVEGTGLTRNGTVVYSDYASLGAYTIETRTLPPTVDVYESNNSRTTAFDLGELSEPVSLDALISSNADNDYFHFTLPDGVSSVKIRIDYDYSASQTALKTYFYKNGSWQTPFTTGREVYEDVEDGRSLYVRVAPSSWTETTPYTLTITPLGLVEEATVGAVGVSSYEASSGQGLVVWDPIVGAASYSLLLSADGGASWTEAGSNLSQTFAAVDGLEPGVSYALRVYGTDGAGARLEDYDEGFFAPIALTTDSPSYALGDTIAVSLVGAADASADVRWYYATDDGDVEIVDAAGRYEYSPRNADYAIKIVATGTGRSQGANAEVVVAAEIGTIDFDYDAATRKAWLSWDAIAEAWTYTVKISKNGGETWINYARDVRDVSAAVNGLYVGKSYGFRVYGVDGDGATLPIFREGTFAPISIAAAAPSYALGATVSVALRGAENATAEISWFYVTDDGDLEIPEAAGLTEYTPANADYDLKIVATGTGASKGSRAEVTIEATGSPLTFDYDESTRQAVLNWNAMDDAASYLVKISKDGGATWLNYARDVAETTATVNGLYVGKSYGFRVYGVDDAGRRTATSYEATFAPIALSSSAPSYVAGETIRIALRGAENATADVAWFYVTDDGDVEIADAAGLMEYTPAIADYDIKVVATGTGLSKGANAELTISAPRLQINFDYDPSTRKATLTWNEIGGASTYVVKISKNDGQTWLNYARDVATTSTVVNGLYVGKTYGFRVYGVDDSGAALASYYEATFAPSTVSSSLLDQAFADFFEDSLFDEI